MPPWEDSREETMDEGPRPVVVSTAKVAYVSIFLTVLVMSFVIMCVKMMHIRQKTRNPQPRRMYVGTRQRPSLTPQEPTVYVSPSNMPPPPKYEFMAPPSYEEVVGVHYPNYPGQPITQPINAALAHSSNATITDSVVVTTVNETAPVSVIVASEPSSTSVTVTRS